MLTAGFRFAQAGRECLEFTPHSRLSSEKKRLRIFALAAEFERAEILVPESFWQIRFRFHPETELVQVLQADVAVTHAFDKVVPKRSRESGPGLDLRHLLTEDKASHLIAELLDLFGIRRCSKAFSKSEKSSLLFLLCFEALLDQFDQHTVVAETPFPGDAIDLLGQPRGQGYAPANLFGGCHGTSIHH